MADSTPQVTDELPLLRFIPFRRLDFEIDDALAKLLTLGLARREGEHWLPLQGPETNRP
jgi:hypothetical protein